MRPAIRNDAQHSTYYWLQQALLRPWRMLGRHFRASWKAPNILTDGIHPVKCYDALNSGFLDRKVETTPTSLCVWNLAFAIELSLHFLSYLWFINWTTSLDIYLWDFYWNYLLSLELTVWGVRQFPFKTISQIVLPLPPLPFFPTRLSRSSILQRTLESTNTISNE